MAGTELVHREEMIGTEQSVIGSMLIDPRVIGLVVSELTEEDFALEVNRTLFRGMRAMFAAGKVVDPVTLLDEVAPGDSGVYRYVLELMDLTPTAANIREYMERTRYSSRRRRLQAVGEELARLQDLDRGQELVARAQAVLSDRGRDDEADMCRAALDFHDALEHTPQYLPWGLPFLDEGLEVTGGEFVVLGGRPSDGKTAMALHMAYAQSRTRNVGFFTLEDSREKLFARLMSSVSQVPLRDLRRRRLDEGSFAAIAEASDQITARRLRIIESAGWTAAEIAARTLQRKFDIIYIDYLQLIHTAARGGTREEAVAEVSRTLANLARRNGVTVVALSQLSRPREKERRGRPVLADLRESGQIEQDADVVMFVWRRDESQSNTERYLTVAKNKTGMLGSWTLFFKGEVQRFSAVHSTEYKPRRREPEYKQQSMYPLPDRTPVPWESEYDHVGEGPITKGE